MKKFNITIICLLTLVIFSCKENSKEPELPWPGGGGADINPEKTEVRFGSKGDTTIINTENIFTGLHLYASNGNGVRPINYTKDTVTDRWTKLIAVNPKKYTTQDGRISITAQKVKIIVFDNTTGQERERSIFLSKENSGVTIKLIQSGN